MMAHDRSFEDILQHTLVRLQAGEAVSSILSNIPEYSTALGPLLQTALELKQWSPPRLSARAREAGRARALHKFQSSNPRAQDDARYIFAILQFDSGQRAPRIGVRHGRDGMRQLVFDGQDYAVDLRMNPDGPTWTITGQVLGLYEDGYVELRDTAGGATRAKLEDMAMFTLPGVLPGSYTLTLYLDQMVISLPPLEVDA